MPAHNEIFSLYDAIRALKKRGIEWTHLRRDKFPDCRRYRFDGSLRQTWVSVHSYFMNASDQDVAYFTPIMETLFIHDTPRDWGKPALTTIPIVQRND